MKQKLMNYFAVLVLTYVLRAIFEYADTRYQDLKKVASYVRLFRLPIAYAKQSL